MQSLFPENAHHFEELLRKAYASRSDAGTDLGTLLFWLRAAYEQPTPSAQAICLDRIERTLDAIEARARGPR